MKQPGAFHRNSDSSHCYWRFIQWMWQNISPKGTKPGVSEGHYGTERTKEPFFVGFVPRSWECPWLFLSEWTSCKGGAGPALVSIASHIQCEGHVGREYMSQNIPKCMNMARFVGRACNVYEAIWFPKDMYTQFEKSRVWFRLSEYFTM